MGGINKMASTVLTGEKLARAVVQDFASFFCNGKEINIPIVIGKVDYASTRGSSKNSSIIISKEMAEEVIDNPKDLFFHLLILGHEICHAVLLHNSGNHQENNEFRALEMWADFYGTKIALCLITYGKNLKSIFFDFFTAPNFLVVVEAMGEAVGLLIKYVYRENDHYPHPIVRVGSVMNGTISFFWKELKNQHPIWPYSIIRRMMASPEAYELRILYDQRLTEGFELNGPVRQWHINIQGKNEEIVPGLRLPIRKHLYSSFIQTQEEWEARVKLREKELIAMGLLEEMPSGELTTGSFPPDEDSEPS